MPRSQESSTTAEKEATQKKGKESSSVSEPTILSHLKLLERRDSIDSNMSAEIVHNYDSDTDTDCHMDSQGPEPTNRDIMRLLYTINVLMNSKLEALGNRVEQLRAKWERRQVSADSRRPTWRGW